ncbi:MAG TPA: 1,4-alpha-glucan branching enzyme, partial [Nitrospiraceae bacterium]|nr:1,4-alpha-glucan branching enzyme [Nitrospiraceae bacterium]
PGDEWQKKANLRLLFGYMFAHPGKKLLFMGGEFGQWREWSHEESLEWYALQYPAHRELRLWVGDLNHFYRQEPALFELDFIAEGFEWVDTSDWEHSIVSFLRKGRQRDSMILTVCNFTPEPRYNYRVGVPEAGFWQEAMNSDAREYGGSGHGNTGGVSSTPVPCHGRYHSISLTLPPLGILIFKYMRDRR